MANVLSNYKTATEKHYQVVYLFHKMNYSIQEIMTVTGYTQRTVETYIKLYIDDLENAIRYFENTPDEEVGNYCYWIRVYENSEYLFDKIGTTTRTVNVRLQEVIRTGWKGHTKNLTYDIIDIFNCGDTDPRGLEELIHGVFISKKYQYLPNDRFAKPLDSKAIYDIARQFGYV